MLSEKDMRVIDLVRSESVKYLRERMGFYKKNRKGDGWIRVAHDPIARLMRMAILETGPGELVRLSSWGEVVASQGGK